MVKQGYDIALGHKDDDNDDGGLFFLCDEIKFLRHSAEWVRCRGNLYDRQFITCISRFQDVCHAL